VSLDRIGAANRSVSVTETREIAVGTHHHHCPPWCVKDDVIHDRETRDGDGRARHLSATWIVDGFDITLTSTSGCDGSTIKEPSVRINGVTLTPTQARKLATAIAAAGALAG
jgi:hypothetical protein